MGEDTGPTAVNPPAGPGPAGPIRVHTGDPPLASRGDTIGHYKLLDLVGEGGFGEVWLAEQTEPVRRRVALKVIKPGMDSRAVIARFEAERQALAIMNHPNVAKVLDAGTTPGTSRGGGRPYFVMEYVKGAPITEYCDRHRLTIEQRLRLFAVVCDAVQHAHMQGIIHRDLKPSNILVVTAGGEPRPVVIDFGVAKALAGRLTEQTIYTERGVLIGTPEYMSPEQAEMAETDIDTRTDVYSLGVVLYELLTGAVPFDGKTLRANGLTAIQRIIRTVDPPRPSARLSAMGKGSGSVAAARQLALNELESLLRRELEWIPLKALRKDRSDRYRSASELADDVGNYLGHRPLIAGPESTAYKVRKFVRRNKGGAAAAGVIVASLVLATAVSVWFGLRESVARARESQERAEAVGARAAAETNAAAEAQARKRAEDINTFVIKALQSSDPSSGGKQETTIADAMQNAITGIDSGAFKDDPETEAGLRDTIATILLNNGKAAAAEPLFAEALDARRRLFKGDHPDVALSLTNLASVRQVLGRAREAEPMFVEALDMYRRLYKGDDPALAASLNSLAFERQALGRAAEAEPLFVEALEMRRRLFKGDNQDVALSLLSLAFVRQATGRPAEAEPLLIEGLEMNRRLFKGDHPFVAQGLNDLAQVRMALGRPAEAEPLLVEGLEMRRRLYKGDHPAVAISLINLAAARQVLGKTAEARQGFDEGVAMLRRLTPAGSPLVARVLWRSGSARMDTEGAAAALPELEEAVTVAERFLPAEHPQLKEYRATLAKCQDAMRK